MNRTLLIARREFAAYAKTVGFWLSLLAFPLFAVLGGAIPILMKSSEPVREVVVLEESPQATGLAAAVQTALNEEKSRRDQIGREAQAKAGKAGG
ncbi:MAG: ABC transporter permease, partial [Brevundimonas sp.]|nr:ABC transporter permease [Brevundimonas sp.]